MKSKFLALSLLLLTGCSSLTMKDPRPYEETKHTIENARNYIDNRSIDEKIEAYEKLLLDRHFNNHGTNQRFFVSAIELQTTNDPFGYNDPYRIKTINDSAVVGGRVLSYFALKYAYEQKEGNSSLITQINLKESFEFVRTLCEVSGIPGLVVHGFIPPGYDFDLKEHYYRVSEGKYKGYIYKSDTSPPQYVGIARGLQDLWIYGPDEYKPEVARLIREIAEFLIKNDSRIIDVDGTLTSTSYFDFPMTVLKIGETGIFFDPKYMHFDTGNRGNRTIGLLLIMRFAAIANNSPELTDHYLSMRSELKAVKNSISNTFGISQLGEEIGKFEYIWHLMNPELRGKIQDDDFQDIYLNLLEELWKLTSIYDRPLSVVIYNTITGNEIPYQASIDYLNTMPTPKRKITVINSNRPDIKLNHIFYFGKNRKPILAPGEKELPIYERGVSQYEWTDDPRWIDVEGSGKSEYSYIDFLYAAILMKYYNAL